MDEKLIDVLKNGGIAVIPTDTIYGIVGSALNSDTVEKIYRLRKRSPAKPMIILISDLNDLNHFNIKLTDKQKEFLEKNWPNPLSVILSCDDEKFTYLHRGTKTLAFRIPKDGDLLKLLEKTGPLVAPSANFEGDPPAENIEEAKKYFGDQVFYCEATRSSYMGGGILTLQPSTLIKLNENGSYQILREGEFKIA